MPAPYAGGCQCGAFRFEITAEPVTAYVCHCVACQKQSGSAFGMAIMVPSEAITVLKGEARTYTKTAQSGRESDCSFCPECGNRIFHRGKDAPMISVKTGLLDDASGIEPAAHLWVSEAVDWVTIPGDFLQFDTQPADGMGAVIEAYKG